MTDIIDSDIHEHAAKSQQAAHSKNDTYRDAGSTQMIINGFSKSHLKTLDI